MKCRFACKHGINNDETHCEECPISRGLCRIKDTLAECDHNNYDDYCMMCPYNDECPPMEIEK
jgi:hypothetical protein